MHGHTQSVRARGWASPRTLVAVALLLTVLAAGSGRARAPGTAERRRSIAPGRSGAAPGTRRAEPETLWIFDADFEDLTGDNTGWTTSDMSGRPPCTNFWHKDTIRLTEEYLGESTWWCGTYNTCWRQPRGYGNDWICCLERDLPISQWSQPGDYVELEWDNRYAMEYGYDYGYLDVSTDAGTTWTTLRYVTNRSGWPGPPGLPVDWDHPTSGHPVQDMSPYAGTDVRVRFRFESDYVYSSEDQYDNVHHSVKDGAWQLDNIKVSVNDATVWFDDCEAPGDNGWIHEHYPGEDQTGVVFRRAYEEFEDPYTHELHAGWMMAAYDSLLGRLVNGQRSWLLSPAVNISGAPLIVGEWSGWLDLTPGVHDVARVRYHSMSDPGCVGEGRFYSIWYSSASAPSWVTVREDLDYAAGDDWLEIRVEVYNYEPIGDPKQHGLGFVLDRLRVGLPVETAVADADPGECRLDLAGPSPFAASTVITYATAQPGRAAVRVYDLSGRVVRTLVDRVVEPGEHELFWDGTTDSGDRAASGVYFVRMEADGFRASEKLVFLK